MMGRLFRPEKGQLMLVMGQMGQCPTGNGLEAGNRFVVCLALELDCQDKVSGLPGFDPVPRRNHDDPQGT